MFQKASVNIFQNFMLLYTVDNTTLKETYQQDNDFKHIFIEAKQILMSKK